MRPGTLASQHAERSHLQPCECPAAGVRHQLPSRQELLARFGLFQGECTPEVAANGEVRCRCEQCGQWKAFLQGCLQGGPSWRQYEVWTSDYIDALVVYLWRRAEELELDHMRVLEIGGGDGRLSAHLRMALAAACPATTCRSITLRCSDSGLCGLHANSPFRQSVELLPCEEALAEHQPDIVLCSWMPLGVDWTSSVRACPQVKEYILIGEADGGICGHQILTWGGSACSDTASEADQALDLDSSTDVPGDVPAEAEDCSRALSCTDAYQEGRGQQCWICSKELGTTGCCGTGNTAASNNGSCPEQGQPTKRHRGADDLKGGGFLQVDLPELSRLQLCCTDERWLTATNSRTVSFRRHACCVTHYTVQAQIRLAPPGPDGFASAAQPPVRPDGVPESS